MLMVEGQELLDRIAQCICFYKGAGLFDDYFCDLGSMGYWHHWR